MTRTPPMPRAAQVRRWRKYLADERAEAAVYRELAERKTGEERAILLGLAEAEGRHEAHWLELLGDDAGSPARRPAHPGPASSSPAGSGRCSCSRSRSAPRPARRTTTTRTRPRRWPPTSASTARSCAVSRRADAPGRPAASAPRCSAPTTGWCPTSRSCSASARPGVPPRHRAVHRDRRPARRRPVDGRGGVRLGALAAGAARGIPARPRVAGRARPPRRRRERARPGLPRARHVRGRGDRAGRAGARRRGTSTATTRMPWAPTRRTRSAPRGAPRSRASVLRVGRAHPRAAVPLRSDRPRRRS